MQPLRNKSTIHPQEGAKRTLPTSRIGLRTTREPSGQHKGHWWPRLERNDRVCPRIPYHGRIATCPIYWSHDQPTGALIVAGPRLLLHLTDLRLILKHNSINRTGLYHTSPAIILAPRGAMTRCFSPYAPGRHPSPLIVTFLSTAPTLSYPAWSTSRRGLFAGSGRSRFQGPENMLKGRSLTSAIPSSLDSKHGDGRRARRLISSVVSGPDDHGHGPFD